MNLHSYPSIYTLGHKALETLLDGSVVVQEKVDGSQFSFGLVNGELSMRSKGAEVYAENPGMFKLAVETATALAQQERLMWGWIYRGEFLAKPHHNALTYGRVPKGNIVLFDINKGDQSFVSPSGVSIEAAGLGLEAVPLLFEGGLTAFNMLTELLERDSFLGNVKVEGVVIKNYAQFGPDKKALMGKHVSEKFKEVHKKEWRNANPGRGDVVENLIHMYRTEARWLKAIQRRRDAGELLDAPQDIGPLLRDIQGDVQAEEMEEIKTLLFKAFWPQVSRGIAAGFAEWYKERLAKQQFDNAPNSGAESP